MSGENYSFLDNLQRGIYFSKKSYDGEAVYSYEEVEDKLPLPYVESEKLWTDCNRYALKILFKNTHIPKKGSGYVSNFVDAAFNKNIFLWDTVFMTMFCNLMAPYTPGIKSLDNFYAKQFDDGEIPREMVRDTGKDFLLWVNAFDKPLYSYFHKHYKYRGINEVKGKPYEELYRPDLERTVEKNPYLTLDNLNHPILAWGELESWKQTGDTARLAMVAEPLWHYYDALVYHLRHKSNLYVTDWASMDNSPRNKNLYLGVDISSEMVLFADNLLRIFDILESSGYEVNDRVVREERLRREKEATTKAINEHMWDPETGFYYDLDQQKNKIKIKTVAAFWTIISGVASDEQVKCLALWLDDRNTFNRLHRVPSLAADEPAFDKENGWYYRGSVWASLNTMIILGLEERGYYDLARDIAINDLDCISKIFESTGTIWENYPSENLTKGISDHPDFVGWSGMAPIMYLPRFAIGIEPSGRDIAWHLYKKVLKKGHIGCKRYWWHSMMADFDAYVSDGNLNLDIVTSDKFDLTVYLDDKKYHFEVSGNSHFEVIL